MRPTARCRLEVIQVEQHTPPAGRNLGPRVGLFGLLGSGNVGNEGSLDAVILYLRSQHPDAVLDFMCSGPEQMTRRYAAPATHLHWHRDSGSGSRLARALDLPASALGLLLDAARTASWVRRQDLVIVPGMGVLEATLPLRPWQTPYALLLLTASGRLFHTKVALVSVGANVMRQRLTRLLLTTTARLAAYRSYRDERSREAMRRLGLDVTNDHVYPDLAFFLPTPVPEVPAPRTVGVGVIDYHGGNDDRPVAAQLHADYVAKMKRVVLELLEAGRRVRMFTGDPADERVVTEILSEVERLRPDLLPACDVSDRVTSLDDLMRRMAPVESVIASRFHNVLCALKLGLPTVSVGYALKNDDLMADMGLADYCQSIRELDVDLLLRQLAAAEAARDEIRATLIRRNREQQDQLQCQFDELTQELIAASGRRPDSAQPDGSLPRDRPISA